MDYLKDYGYVDIKRILNDQQLPNDTNQYGLSVVNGVEFHCDSFIYDGDAYLYNVLTRTEPMEAIDKMPAFARIITDNVKDGNVLLRLDHRLALPANEEITYSSVGFQQYRGPQLDFHNLNLSERKTITVHYNAETMDKILMVIKRDYDNILGKEFLHIEIETLPFIKEGYECDHYITTFLHGMYYPDADCFTHIDFTRNQYPIDDYRAKQSDASPDKPIDFYTLPDLHYKIWCIENGKYSREVWYKLMIVSLTQKFQKLFNEMVAGVEG